MTITLKKENPNPKSRNLDNVLLISNRKSFYLRTLTGKKYPKIKLQCLQKIRIWTFGSLVHQINSF